MLGWTKGNVDLIILAMPAYLTFWFALGLIAAWKTMGLFGFPDKIRSWTILSAAAIPTFFLFSASILTESAAFATTMLGIYLIIRFHKDGNLWAPPLAALCFVAAAYTRLDFVVLQMFGWVPLLFGPPRKRVAVALILFTIPAAIFLVWPNNIPAAVPSTAISIGSTGSSLPGSGPPPPSSPSNPLAGISAQLVRIVVNSSYFFSSGLAGGFGPVPILLILGGFLFCLAKILKRKGYGFIFLVGSLALSPFIGVSLVYAPAAFGLFLGTIVRYSYDAMPAFFIFAPILFTRFSGRKFKAGVVVGLLGYLALAGIFSQPVLQSSLGASYPFLGGHQPFMTLDYRTPMASIRDYLHTLSPQRFVILGEDPGSLDANLTNLWRFTPGVSGLDVDWKLYSFTGHADFIYLPPDINQSSINIPSHLPNSVADWLWKISS